MKLLRLSAAGAALLLMAGCTQAQLQATGMSTMTAAQVATVTQTLASDGQLFCQVGNAIYQAGDVKVTNATAASVAAACGALEIGSAIIAGAVPVPVQAGTQVQIATVPAPVAAAVAARTLSCS